MNTEPPTRGKPKRTPVRGVLVIVGVSLVALLLIAVAIYAGAYLMLAPMMH